MWNTPLSVPDTGCREEGRFLLKQPAQKRQSYNIILFTIQTQIHTNTSIVQHKCASPQISVHSMTWFLQCCRCLFIPYSRYCVYSKELGERNFWLREGISARSGACPRLWFAKGIPEAILLTANKAMTTGELWMLAFISMLEKHLSFHKLHRPSLAPGISFHQDMARYPLRGMSSAIRDVTAHRQVWLFSSRATAWSVKGERISAYCSAKPARQAEVTSCGGVGRDPWCMAAYLTPPATCNTIVWLGL